MVARRAEGSRKRWQSAAARRLLAIAGNPSTVNEAVRIVGGKFLENVECPPTNLEAVQNRLNVKRIETEDLPFSGELRRGRNGFTIVLSKHLSPSRRRFTVAHELGHAILETTGPRCPRFGSELERLCDMLATEILMPHSLFRTLAQERLSISKVWELSRVFGTSLTATALRGAELVGCSAFEIEADTISWGYGIVRKGRLKDLDYQDLRIAVRQAEGSDTGEAQVYIWNQKWQGDCKLEWTRLRGGSRTLFLLQPISQVRQSRNGLREARVL
jgi:hypothetical protein